MRNSYRILICEPDAKARQKLKAGFGTHPHRIIWSGNSAEATAFLETGDFDAAVLCLAPGSMQPWLLDWMDRTTNHLPLLIASPADAVEARVLSLEHGASDYLLKPFDLSELEARIATVLHRRATTSSRYAQLGKVKLDRRTGYLGNGTHWVALTPKERQAFSLLVESGDRPVSKSQLKDAIADGKGVSDNALEVIIHRLRAKASQWGMNIRAYRGSGYVLEYP